MSAELQGDRDVSLAHGLDPQGRSGCAGVVAKLPGDADAFGESYKNVPVVGVSERRAAGRPRRRARRHASPKSRARERRARHERRRAGSDDGVSCARVHRFASAAGSTTMDDGHLVAKGDRSRAPWWRVAMRPRARRRRTKRPLRRARAASEARRARPEVSLPEPPLGAAPAPLVTRRRRRAAPRGPGGVP